MSLGIEVRDLTVRYGKKLAVDNLSLSLQPGQIHGLLGRNGSGKSTLLSVLAAFRKQTSGTVLVGGEPIFENARMMPQVCLIREAGDTVENGEKVQVAFDFAREMRPCFDATYAQKLAKRFELPLDQKIGSLSRGQRSAVGVTLGLASQAPLTMFDESYLGMDAPSRYIFYEELLQDFMDRPRTIVLSTHLIEEVSQLFEDVVILDHGKLVLHDPVDDLLARGAIVTGPAETVDRFVSGLRVLESKQLGGTKSVVVYANVSAAVRTDAVVAGLEIGPLPLQDLFVHLTTEQGE